MLPCAGRQLRRSGCGRAALLTNLPPLAHISLAADQLMAMLTRDKSFLEAITDIRRLCAGSRRTANGSLVASAGSLSLDTFFDTMCDEGYTGARIIAPRACSLAAPYPL